MDGSEPHDRARGEMTRGADYTERLDTLQRAWWKKLLPVQAPYRWNVRRLRLGYVRDVSCGL